MSVAEDKQEGDSKATHGVENLQTDETFCAEVLEVSLEHSHHREGDGLSGQSLTEIVERDHVIRKYRKNKTEQRF